jgi:hypothetical protein
MFVLLSVACSSSGGGGPAELPGVGGSSNTGGSAGAGAGGSAGAFGNGVFDLTVDFSHENFGETKNESWTIAVRDAASDELVLFETTLDPLEPSLSQKTLRFQRAFPGVLQEGHTYRVGVAIISPGQCQGYGDQGAWYFELSAVDAAVALQKIVTWGQDADPQGCELMFEPTPLPPGLYRNAGPILGKSANEAYIEVVVSPSGHIHQKAAFVTCPDQFNTWEWCSSALQSGQFSCAGHVTPFPGTQQFRIGSSGTSAQFSAVATVDAASGTIGVSGVTKGYTPSGDCCVADVVTELVHVGESSECP